jgi:GNAT superfamily N-acetyltransferase
MSLSVRALGRNDAARVNMLLAGARDETMFLRSNLRHGGFVFEGRPFQAKYFGAFVTDTLVGVAALCWNGMVLVYAPYGLDVLLEALMQEAAEHGPPISGLAGPTHQLHRARAMLDFTDRPVLHDVDADLFALNLDTLKRPALLDAPGISLRRPRLTDLPVLVDWEIGYRIEALGDRSAGRQRAKIQHALAQQLATGTHNIRMLERDGMPVSRTMFGATLADMVQVGGVWTPQEQRGKGYGRAVVAGSLHNAAIAGVRRAVLFAHEPHAIRAYEALGFLRVGHYTLVTLAEPMAPRRRYGDSNASPPPHPPTAA